MWLLIDFRVHYKYSLTKRAHLSAKVNATAMEKKGLLKLNAKKELYGRDQD
jgi:hypothetical protein